MVLDRRARPPKQFPTEIKRIKSPIAFIAILRLLSEKASLKLVQTFGKL